MLEIYSLIKKFKKNFFCKKSGVSLLELLIGISLLAILTSLVFKKPKSDYQILHENIENIFDFFQKSFSNALYNQKLYEIRFYFSDDYVLTKMTSSLHEKKDASKGSNVVFSLELKDEIKIKKLIINGKNEFDSGKIKETWILIFPEGYTQEVEIHFETKKDKIYEIYQINPFNCKFIYKSV